MNTKPFISIGVLLLLLFNPIRVAADKPAAGVFGAEGIHPGQDGANTASVRFSDLGYIDSELVGPLDGTRKVFSVPANWTLKPGGMVVLEYDVLFSGADVGRLSSESNTYTGALTVSFNSWILGYIRLDSGGSKTTSFVIPEEAIQSIRESGQHELNIQLNAQLDCIYDIRTVVVIKAVSRFDLLFDITSPELNLSQLPAPFYLRNSLLPDRTLLVVSPNSTAEELQAAMDVMSGFGSLVERPIDMRLITEDKLTEEERASSNLIFVGMPGNKPLLESVGFPLAIQGGKFVGLSEESANDGIVELAHSPWNPNKVVLLVSGNSGEAVVKAAQAIGSGKIIVYQNPTLALIRDVQDLAGNLPIVQDFTLKELGYESERISGIGINQVDYTFFASKEQLASKNGLLSLVYYHSGLMDYGVSSLSVDINGQVIVSVPFSEETEQITTLDVKIPPGLLRFGENQLTVQARMQPDLSCDFSGFSDPWLLISNLTGLHLPISDGSPLNASNRLDLKNFPGMFMNQSDLGDVAFVVAENDPVGWKIAADLAYNLGSIGKPSISHLSAAFAGDVSEELRANYSLILIGKASTLPLLTEINESLPAPFDLKTNTAEEKGMQIVYRIPAGVSVGYLELISSPFNKEKLLLLVSGNSDEGLAMAGGALSNDQLKDQLAGVFAMTNGVQVAVSESGSYFSDVGSIFPGSEQVVVTPIPTSPEAHNNLAGPAWLLPMLVASAIVILLIIFIAVIGAFRKNRSPKFDELQDSAEDTETPEGKE